MTALELINAGRLRPLGDRLIARMDKVQQVGSLFLPPDAQYEHSTATVVAIGDKLPEYLVPGVRIMPHAASGLSIYDDDTTRLVAYQLADIQAVFTEGPTEEALDYVKEHTHD
ncbi:MAG TPA: hypothetical protein VLH56_18770 [Dissulfurispiraceae bacterium]|nr:hypothetical protein [Dissulfurispiraceae bacterium]